MFKNLLIFFVAVLCCSNILCAQNVFSPGDPIVTYSSGAALGSPTHPNQPAGNVMSKWVRTQRVSWTTTNFKSYIWNGMAFRLRFPNNYNPANATKYPVIVFFHGGGETGTIYDNEDQLYWGAQIFEQRINNGEWNGFLLFPQETSVGWDDSYFSRYNSVLDTLQKYNNSDPDRVISMGLSSGGYGAIAYASAYPKRVAVSLASSPAQARTLGGTIPGFVHVPVWMANGGTDVNPDPYNAQAFYQDFRNAGGNIYQSYYVNDGHGTWTDMWNQKNAAGAYITTTYWNSAHKAQPLVYFQNQQFCPGSISARMGITAGYFAYEWQLNGSTLGGANGNEYTAKQAGQYRVRFMRVAGGTWSAWTPNPVVISAKTCATDTLFAEHFTYDNYYYAASEYKISTFTCQNGIMTSGTDLFTQDATGVQGSRFLINYTGNAGGCTYTAGDNVWNGFNPVIVLPNTNYEYSFYLGNQNATSPAQIAPTINGTALIAGSVSATGTGNASWKKFTYTWNSGSAASANLALINKSVVTNGNDFAIDEICFKVAPGLPVPGCTANTSPANGASLVTNTTASLVWTAAANAASYDVYLWTGATAPTTPVANISTTSYGATGLTGSSLYKWYVVPKNASGVGATGCVNNQTNFTTAVTPVPPSCVTNSSPANGALLGTTTTATLTWSAAATATSYDVYLWKNGTAAPTTATANVSSTTYGAASLTASSLYNWYVVPKNAVGASTGCSANATTFTTASVPTAPSCVSNSSPANGTLLGTTTSATLTWTAAASATSYDVYLWKNGTVAPTTATANVTVTTYNATGLTASSLYNWYIVPKNTVGASTGCSVNATTFTTASVPTAPSCVSNSSPANGTLLGTTTTATLTWTAAASATSYDVYLWKNGSAAPTIATANVTVTTYNAAGLTASSLYNWYTVPKNAVGTPAGCSANATTFTTAAIPTAPSCVTNISPANGAVLGANTAILTWTAAATATSYDVYLWKNGTTAPTSATANVTGTSYTTASLLASSLYNWYIVPKNTVGSATGCNANVTGFTTPASSSTLLGYIKMSVGAYQACDDNSSTGRIPVYGTGGIANGTVLYADAALTTIYNGGWNWFSFTPTIGGTTLYAFAIYPSGGIFLLRDCITGTSLRVVAGTATTAEQDNATLNRLRDSATVAGALIAANTSKLAIFPNPVTRGQLATLKINSNTGGIAVVQITGVAGNILQTQQLNVLRGANTRTVQTTGLASGIYIISISGSVVKASILKLIIQ